MFKKMARNVYLPHLSLNDSYCFLVMLETLGITEPRACRKQCWSIMTLFPRTSAGTSKDCVNALLAACLSRWKRSAPLMSMKFRKFNEPEMVGTRIEANGFQIYVWSKCCTSRQSPEDVDPIVRGRQRHIQPKFESSGSHHCGINNLRPICCS
jgi:hypothetical protein